MTSSPGAPGVAVVIPSYQSARFLDEAIDSVLAQSRPVEEIVVVDDGSTDGSLAVARGYEPRVRVIAQPNRGAGAARMAGFRVTVAGLVAFLDADDRWRPEYVDHLADVLERHPGALLAHGAIEVFHDLPDPSGPRLASLVAGPAVLLSSTLMRREVFDVVGPFGDDNFSSIDWFMRVVELGLDVARTERVVVDRRIHDANTSANDPRLAAIYTRKLKASLDRRRGGAGAPA